MRKFVIALLVLSSSAFAADVDIYGIKLGQKPELPICELHYGTASSPDSGQCMEFRSDGKAADVLFSINSCPKYTFDCRITVFINKEGNAVGFEIPTGGEGSRQYAQSVLLKKFGKPSSSASERVQTRIGARFVNREHIWKKQGFVVRHLELNGSLNEGRITIDTSESIALKRPRSSEEARM